MVVRCHIPRDRAKPGTEARSFTQVTKTGKRAQKDILNQVFHFARVHSTQEDAVDHAGVTLVELAKRLGIAPLGGLHQGHIGVFQNGWRFRHHELLQDCGGGLECTLHALIPWQHDDP